MAHSDKFLAWTGRGPAPKVAPGLYTCPCRKDILEPSGGTDEELSGDKPFSIYWNTLQLHPGSMSMLLINEINIIGPASEGLDLAVSSSKHGIKTGKKSGCEREFSTGFVCSLY